MHPPRLSERRAPLALAALLCARTFGCAAPETPYVSPERALPSAWYVVWSPPGQPPLISFHFAPPQDAYYGEVHRASGHLRFGEGLTLDRARGRFFVYAHAVDMGDPDLTLNVQNAIDMLHARRFPKIYYDVRSVSAQVDKLSFQEATPVVLHGRLRLKGVTIVLDVDAVVQPTLDAGGEPILVLTGSFRLTNLKRRFDITGPGDPEVKEADEVMLDFNFPLVPFERYQAIHAEQLRQGKTYSEQR